MIDANHTLAASAVVLGAIALTDVRVAAVALGLLAPLLLLAKRGNATFRSCQISADEAAPLADGLRRAGTVALIEAEGPLLFLSVPSIDRLLPAQSPWPSYVILDLRAVTTIDASALTALRDLLHEVPRGECEFLLVSAPGSAVSRALSRSGLAACALGGTTCFGLELALERIAARHRNPDHEPSVSRPSKPHLHLVHSATPSGE